MSKQNKSYSRPLLYIHQPSENDIEAPMQTYASFKQTIQRGLNEQEDLEVEEVPNNVGSTDKRRAFKDMSIEEKLSYLTNLPSQMPPMKCEVITEENRFRGVVQSVEDDQVKMSTFQAPYKVEFPVQSIQDIRLKGF